MKTDPGYTDLDVTPEPGERCTCRNLPAAHPAGAPGCESAPPTLVVSEWSTVCSACGRGADPTEIAHRTVLETRTLAGHIDYYTREHPGGCGEVFEQIAAAKHASRTSEAFTPRMRPELPYVGRWPR